MLNARKKKILLFADWYEPGYKAGGPIRSCVNFTRHMQDEYEIYVFTTDRDLGSPTEYEDIPKNEWIAGKGGGQVFYCSPPNLRWHTIHQQMTMLRPDVVYLNSMFSGKFTIIPLLIDRTYRLKSRIILSPRGMLRSSAVRFKLGKKKAFFKSFRWLGFHRRIEFLASDDTEVNDIRRYFGPETRITKIPNFPAALPATRGVKEKSKGDLSMIYIGRIHPIKNLDYLLLVLKEVRANIRLTVVGSVEDESFWLDCRTIMKSLPANIRVTHAGEIPNDQLPPLIAEHHIFVLPTKGENFGHAIFEALALGKPALISDQTPWRGLQSAGAGWDLPLDRPAAFRLAIEEAAACDGSAYADRCRTTWKYIENYIARLDLKDEYKKLFG